MIPVPSLLVTLPPLVTEVMATLLIGDVVIWGGPFSSFLQLLVASKTNTSAGKAKIKKMFLFCITM